MNNTLTVGKSNTNIENLRQQNRIEEFASARKASFVALSILSALTIASYVFYPNITNAVQLGVSLLNRGLSLAIGGMTAAVPFVIRGLSLVIGGMTIYVAKTIYEEPNYSNPANIIKYKEAAGKDPLHQTLKKHQPCDLILFGILDKARFDAKLNEELASMTTVKEMENYVSNIRCQTNGFFRPFDDNYKDGLKKQMQNQLQKKCADQTFKEIVEKQGFITAVEWKLIPTDTIKKNEEEYKKLLNTHKKTIESLYPILHYELRKYKIA